MPVSLYFSTSNDACRICYACSITTTSRTGSGLLVIMDFSIIYEVLGGVPHHDLYDAFCG